ncbi:fatty acid-binding protein DegV [Paenibacillus sambharensis]|uniref:Fatty acid-binding protein DegV n=1 Tax=Paenibacillus sambharensis TaxID=1803190 RepID=A0A2W1LMR0_9BACL|nr:DegV family protein [Paenibacillus sambharensis]PZD96175.1 fatty acid-binding protein DegV [Paenibacillus sambharensis]
MPGIKIVTDSTTDLPQDLLKALDVEVIPLTVLIGGESYLDSVTLDPLDFLRKMKQTDELPKTSQPAIGSFIETYDRLGANGDTILSIHMTSGMSGTYSTACAAAGMTDSRVEVVDSQMISQGLGFQVVEAAQMARDGSTLEAIKQRLKEILDHTSLFVVVDTLENLIKGGRIGKAAGWIGSFLSIKPIASLEKGVYTPVTKVRTTSRIVKTLMEKFEQDIKGKVVKGIGISHADNLPLAEGLREEIRKLTDAAVRIRPATPVITTHTGEGAIGFMYYAE